jgi:hypothetical protein
MPALCAKQGRIKSGHDESGALLSRSLKIPTLCVGDQEVAEGLNARDVL